MESLGNSPRDIAHNREYGLFEILRINVASTILGKKLWRSLVSQLEWKR